MRPAEIEPQPQESFSPISLLSPEIQSEIDTLPPEGQRRAEEQFNNWFEAMPRAWQEALRQRWIVLSFKIDDQNITLNEAAGVEFQPRKLPTDLIKALLRQYSPTTNPKDFVETLLNDPKNFIGSRLAER